MTWMMSDRMNTRVGGKLCPAGVPFEVDGKDKKVLEQLKRREFKVLSAKEAKAILAGAPEPEEEETEETEDE